VKAPRAWVSGYADAAGETLGIHSGHLGSRHPFGRVISVVANISTTRTQDAIWISLRRTARTTGLLYLGLAVTGLLGAVVVRAQLYAAGDASKTLANLLAHPSLARFGIALELSIVLFQTLTAAWFYRLSRRVDSLSAGLIVVFGMVNATAILGSAALLVSAFDIATNPISSAEGDTAATVQALYVTSGHLWDVGGLFFGLWLIPMGYLAARSRWMPQRLGRLLMAGGVAYIGSAFALSMFPNSDTVGQLLTLPATIGELWIMGYLLVIGIRELGRRPGNGPDSVPSLDRGA